jgi:DNA-binding CsgD family transcriptional regulator
VRAKAGGGANVQGPQTIDPSAQHAESLAARRSGPGLLVFRAPMNLVYRDPWAWRRCQEISQDPAGGAGSTGLPTVIEEVYEEVSQHLKVRTEPKDWEQFRVRRIMNENTRPMLVSGLGVPQPRRPALSHILITIEDIGRRDEGVIDQAKKLFHLTDREVDVAQHILKGWTNKQIAVAMKITEQTVKEHIKHIMQKTGTKTRTGVLLEILR